MALLLVLSKMNFPVPPAVHVFKILYSLIVLVVKLSEKIVSGIGSGSGTGLGIGSGSGVIAVLK